MHYFDEARRIWSQYVPRSGQAATVQGELLRTVEKLRDEAARNGNGNWDEGFEILLRYLDEHLLDQAVYAGARLRKRAKSWSGCAISNGRFWTMRPMINSATGWLNISDTTGRGRTF